MKSFFVGSAALLTAICLSSVAQADGVATSLGQSWDFGDVHGGYATIISKDSDLVESRMETSLSVSAAIITSISISINPNAWPQDTVGPAYFHVGIFLEGFYDDSPGSFAEMSQSLLVAHNGVVVMQNEYLGMHAYGDALWDDASVEVALSPFTVVSAGAVFTEYSVLDLDTEQSQRHFTYALNWLGYADTSLAANTFAALAPTVLDVPTLPEPASLTFLFGGVVLLLSRKSRK